MSKQVKNIIADGWALGHPIMDVFERVVTEGHYVTRMQIMEECDRLDEELEDFINED